MHTKTPLDLVPATAMPSDEDAQRKYFKRLIPKSPPEPDGDDLFPEQNFANQLPPNTEPCRRGVDETDSGGILNAVFIGSRVHSWSYDGDDYTPIHEFTTYYVDALADKVPGFAGQPVTRDGRKFLRRSFASDGELEFLGATLPENLPDYHPNTDEVYEAYYRTEAADGVWGVFYGTCLPLFRSYLRSQPRSLTTDPSYWVMRTCCEMHCMGQGYHTFTRPPFDNLMSWDRDDFAVRYLGPLRLDPSEGDLP